MRPGLKMLLFWLCGGAFVARMPAAAMVPAPPAPLACAAAAGVAERQGGLPADLLASIGVVESGRIDPATGRLRPWPWTVNVDGAGFYFADEQEAAAFAQNAEDSGARDVDVGCFQISLEQHPDAFSTLDAAFDPSANAEYAAHFLDNLKTRTGSWEAAIADYHSAVPAIGLPYRRRVLAAWQGLGSAPEDMEDAFFSVPDPSVILEAPAARLVRVITMDGEDLSRPDLSRPDLPRVITP